MYDFYRIELQVHCGGEKSMAQRKNLIGCRFGKLTVIEKTEKTQDRYAVWKCRCDCGKEVEVNTKRLTRGTITNCGCIPKKAGHTGTGAVDLTGQKFGELTVLSRAEKKGGRTQWNCLCSCGKHTIVSTQNLKAGKTKSCGCQRYNRGTRREDLTGKRFGNLTVLYPVKEKDGKSMKVWHCKCDCGNETDVSESGLIYGNCKSCGCLKQEIWKNIPNQLHRIDGTCVEMLEKRKYRKDNTSGFRGVYQKKNGHYRVMIGFKGKRFYVGTYKKYQDAVEARLEAETQIHDRFVQAYYAWQEEAGHRGTDKEQFPFIFEVERVKGEFQITTNIKV